MAGGLGISAAALTELAPSALSEVLELIDEQVL